MDKDVQFISLWMSVIALIVLMTFHNRISKNIQKKIVLLLVFIFSLMYGYRTLGMDINGYIRYYENFQIDNLANILAFGSMFNSVYEPVYTMWISVSQELGLTFAQSTFIYTLIPMLLFYRIIIKQTDEPLVSFALMIIEFMFYFDLIRMMMGLAWGVTAYYSKRKINKCLLYSLAFLSHYTMVIMPFYEVVAKFRSFYKLKLIYLIFVSPIIAKIITIVVESISNNENRFLFKIYYYLVYYKGVDYVSLIHQILLSALNLYPMIMGMFFFCKYINKTNFQNYTQRVGLNMQKIGVISSIILVTLSTVSVGSRYMLFAIAPLFIIMAKEMAENTSDGRITINAVQILVAFLLYDFIMTFYYLWSYRSKLAIL